MKRVLVTAVLSWLFFAAGAAWGQAAGPSVVDMEFDGARLADVLRVLGELGGYNVIVDAGVEQQASFRLQGMTVDDALEMVIRTSGYSYRRLGNTLVVGPEETLQARFDRAESQVIQLRYAQPDALLPVLRLLVPDLQAHADVAQRAIVMRGTAEDLARAAELIRARDVRPLVDQEYIETPVVDIVRSLARLGGYNLVVEGDIGGRMTVVLDRQPVESAIDLVARRAGLSYEIDGADLIVTASSPGVPGEAAAAPALQAEERRIFQLAHIGPSQVVDAVRVLAGSGQVWVDELSRLMVVSAAPQSLRQIEELIGRLDVPNLAVRGILRQGDAYVGILEIDGTSHIVRAGDTAGAVTVRAVDAGGVLVEAVHGTFIRVPAGG